MTPRDASPETGSRLCDITIHAGRDCPGTVLAGNPFNVCSKHMVRLADYMRQAEAVAGYKYRVPAPCPGCRLTHVLVANVTTQIATCENCGHEMAGDPASFMAQRLVPQPATSKPQDVVYYIRFADRVKIGTTGKLRERLIALPHDELLAVELGGRELEQSRHREFAQLRLTRRGEWFRLEEPLVSHVQQLRSAAPFLQEVAAELADGLSLSS